MGKKQRVWYWNQIVRFSGHSTDSPTDWTEALLSNEVQRLWPAEFLCYVFRIISYLHSWCICLLFTSFCPHACPISPSLLIPILPSTEGSQHPGSPAARVKLLVSVSTENLDCNRRCVNKVELKVWIEDNTFHTWTWNSETGAFYSQNKINKENLPATLRKI